MIKRTLFIAAMAIASVSCSDGIDRFALVERNNPHVTAIDTLSSLSVGNGRFAFTVDVTGLQTFPELYSGGVPLGTMSQWGWHSFANPDSLRFEETLKAYDFGRGHEELYACQLKEGRGKAASDWYRVNPHRLHLGTIGFDGLEPSGIADIDQTLDMWNGVICSSFTVEGVPVSVRTSCDPEKDMVAVSISSKSRIPVAFRFPYPTGQHSDDACDWTRDDLHSTVFDGDSSGPVLPSGDEVILFKRIIDATVYYVKISFRNASVAQTGRNKILLSPAEDDWSFTAEYCEEKPSLATADDAAASASRSSAWWQSFWKKGGVVDFSRCTDPRASELERRVVLSQYLLAIQCCGDVPPQETGLTYNSWFGKHHMEMIWWHQAHFALWGHEDLLARTLPWYGKVEPVAREIAERQGFKGVRWMKMTDPSGREAPSNVGSFLIWQQPHLIYLAELLYRANPSQEIIDEYFDLIQETAEFMADFVTYDEPRDRYILKGCIAAQETLKADKTVNPPYELSYWHFGLSTAQQWRERKGLERDPEWDEIIAKLSPLASRDSLYLAAESEPDTYSDIRMYSDHMAVLAAVGVLPQTPQSDPEIMKNTFDWVYDNWNWDKTWGWDFPTTCMNAVRVGEPEKAINALLMDQRTNTYLPNGHNYQDSRLRCYLPGNGGLLTAVALMCAGWDGCEVRNPGFPKDGTWDVRWEGLKPLP